MTPAVVLVVAATVAGALPPAPGQVVLTGRGSFGEIHFDHPAHLARNIRCATCHGPGQVHKPELTPATAHAICRACHVEQKRGPTSCRDCHLTPKAGRSTDPDPSGAATTLAAAALDAPGATPPPAVRPIVVPAARVDPAASAAHELAFRTSVRAGLVSITGASRGGAGPGIAIDAEEGHRIAGLEVNWTSRPGAQRTLALLGAGLTVPLGGDLRARAVGLCGVDVGTPAYALPTMGARVGVELRGRGARSRLLPAADLSFAYLAGLGTRGVGDGETAREEAFLFALRLGWELPVR